MAQAKIITSINPGSPSSYTSTITAYDNITKIATLSSPVNLSFGASSVALGDISSHYSISGVYSKIDQVVQTNVALAKPTTDESGNYVAVFNVPPSMFQTGSRVFRVDNRLVSIDPTSATSFAEATFIASGLGTKAQNNFGPSHDSSSSIFTQVNLKSTQTVGTSSNVSANTNILNRGANVDPIAQTFIVSKDNYPNGIFLYSVKLFFVSKPTSNIPVTLSIIPTLNGYPNGSSLDYSKVVLYPNQVKVSSTPHYQDPNTGTEFIFDAPVYIQSNVLYAFVVNSSSSDYNLFYGQQNQTALTSTSKVNYTDPTPTKSSQIGAAPYVGALFRSQNGITWTADQTQDLMFVINKCLFNTSTNPSVQFSILPNLPYRKLGTQDIGYKQSANSISQVFGNFSASKNYNALNVTTTDFVPSGTSVNYSYTSTLSNKTQTPAASISPGRFGSPTPDDVYLSDGRGTRVLSKYLNNNFSLYANLSSNDPNVSPIISDDGVTLYTIQYMINNMGLGNNLISIVNSGNGYSNLTSSNVSISPPDIGTNQATIGITASANGSIKSAYIITPGSGYLKTPTVTVTGANNTQAIISIAGETSPKGGNATAKYFTKKVVLNPGNDSGDLRVYYTAYRPPGTNIYIYYKILSALDTSTFESGNWQLMTTISNQNTYSTSRTDLYEYETAPGVFSSNQANNTISYTNAAGQTFTSFIQFAIKVVMTTSDNTTVPYLTDIRVIALPALVGTGF